PCADVLTKKYNLPSREIVCLHPIGSRERPLPANDGPFALFAIRNLDLPRRLTLDWSHEQGFSLAQVIAEDGMKLWPNIMREAVNRIGSLASYDPISAESLRVKVIGGADDPSEWPKLSDTTDADVASLSRSTLLVALRQAAPQRPA